MPLKEGRVYNEVWISVEVKVNFVVGSCWEILILTEDNWVQCISREWIFMFTFHTTKKAYTPITYEQDI